MPNIYSYLYEASQAPPYATSPKRGGRVFVLPGLEDYLLRVEGLGESFDDRTFEQKLWSTTALTPVFVCAQEAGQPRLTGSGFQIVSKVDGQTLYSIFENKIGHYVDQGLDIYRDEPLFAAYRDILELLGKTPVKDFEDIMETINYMTLQRVPADPNWGNLSKGRHLGIFDFLYEGAHDHDNKRVVAQNNLTTLTNGLVIYDDQYIDVAESFPREVQAIVDKVRRAAQKANFPRNEDEVEALIQNRNVPVTGRGLQAIEVKSGDSLPLSASSDDMKRMLDEVRRHKPKEHWRSVKESELQLPSESPDNRPKRNFFFKRKEPPTLG